MQASDAKSEIKRFMKEFFSSRAIEEKRILETSAPYRRKYFASAFRWGKHEEKIKQGTSEGEAILDISITEEHAKVITKPISSPLRTRYFLKKFAGCWLITHIENECLICSSIGTKDNCSICSGSGWSDEQWDESSELQANQRIIKETYELRKKWVRKQSPPRNPPYNEEDP